MSEGEITRVGGRLWVREGMTEEVREGAGSLLWFIDLWAGVHQMESHIYFSMLYTCVLFANLIIPFLSSEL